jgi:hypothetical protein
MSRVVVVGCFVGLLEGGEFPALGSDRIMVRHWIA